MKQRIATLIVTGVLLAGPTTSAFALSREANSPRQHFRERFVKAVKQVKNLLRVTPTEDFPLPPKPCTPGTAGCP